MGRATAIFFGPASWGPGEGQKVKYHLISITKSISNIFIPNVVYVLTNERNKTYQTWFFILLPGSCPRGGTWGCLGSRIEFCPTVFRYDISSETIGPDSTKWSMWVMPRSHIHRSPPRFYYGLNLTDDPGNANIRRPIWMHYIPMIKYYYV